MTKHFIITSHGWSGSNWLAHSLNLHDEIICTHSAINILPDPDFIHEESGLKKNIRKFHKGYVTRVNASINESYDLINSYGEAVAYGSVHLYRLRDIPNQLKLSAPLKHHYSMINMVRNPVSLVWSGYGQFRQLFRFDLNELHWTLGKLMKTDKDFAFEIGDKYDLYIGDYEVLAFLCACRVLESLRLDLDAEKLIIAEGKLVSATYNGTVMMEKLTTDKNSFRQLFALLGLDTIAVSEAYLDKVFATGKLNTHKSSGTNVLDIGKNELFSGWAPWQKEVFLHFFHKYELLEPYKDMGYDLAYLAH